MSIKGRPKKVRYVQRMPRTMQFSPRGKPGRPDEVELAICEYEAIKLSDHQGFSQAQGAVAMHLSRASFGRIVRNARSKVADALVNGKVIRIRMGSAQIGVKRKDFTKEEAVAGELSKFKERNKKMAKEVGQISKSEGKIVAPGGSQRAKRVIVHDR